MSTLHNNKPISRCLAPLCQQGIVKNRFEARKFCHSYIVYFLRINSGKNFVEELGCLSFTCNFPSPGAVTQLTQETEHRYDGSVTSSLRSRIIESRSAAKCNGSSSSICLVEDGVQASLVHTQFSCYCQHTFSQYFERRS